MKSLRYDPNCRDCRTVNYVSTAIVQILAGVCIGRVATGIGQVVILALLAQFFIWIIMGVTNRIQPMTHHILKREAE